MLKCSRKPCSLRSFIHNRICVRYHDDLREVFEEYGIVSDVETITDRATGKPKEFGYIEMPDDENARYAINPLSGTEWRTRTIMVNEANHA